LKASYDKVPFNFGARLGVCAFCAAIALCPISIQLPQFPMVLSPCDLLTALSALLLLPSALSGNARLAGQAVTPVLPLAGVVLLSTLTVGNFRSGLPDLIQLGLYGGAAAAATAMVSDSPYGYRGLKWAAGVAAVLSSAGVMLYAVNSRVSLLLFGAGMPVLLLPAVFTSLYMALAPGKRGLARNPAVFLPVFFLAGSVWVTASGREKAPEAIAELQSPVQQRWLEAYAAVTVLGQSPLLGLGPGKYQSHIGEYYRTLPKDNTLTPGSQLGYAVVTATTGLLGLAAFLFWLFRIADGVRDPDGSRRPLMWPLALWSFVAFFTPPFVTPMLAPIAVIQGLARNGRSYT